MLNSLVVFKANLRDARGATTLYDYLTANIATPLPLDDLLRAQIVNSVSAFDKLMHDIVRIGMCAAYAGTRPVTPKFLGEAIAIEVHNRLIASTIPPKEIVFEQEMAKKLSALSFQDPDKVSDGLSYIWNAKHKWQSIALSMGITADTARTTLKLIAGRRNAIVHEADMNPLTNTKSLISRNECNDITDFIEGCGESIVNLVVTP